MLWIFGFSLLVFAFGYFVYSRYLAKVVEENPSIPTPAHKKKDGVDFVPTNKFILFGHHFASIAGAGPILGPTIAASMYGWGPVWLWIIIGGVFLGAVHDYLSLMISVKNEGKSIFNISNDILGKFAGFFMSLFVLIALIIVVAVFAAFTAVSFVSEPRIVIPTFTILVVALLFYFMAYRLKMGLIGATIVSLVLVGLSIYFSFAFNWAIAFPFSNDVSIMIWIIILLIYSFFASVLPVNLILQPRDYINSYVLVIGILVGVLGILVSSFLPNIAVNAPFFGISEVARDSKTGLVDPLWPILFITVACGAISGFHSLVASGTSSKQLSNEKDGRFVGYGAMLTESLLALTVLIGIMYFIGYDKLVSLVKEGKAIIAFGTSFGNMTSAIIGSWGFAFALLMINGFMLTTLDTATRISRFLTEEIYTSLTKSKSNKYISTFFVVLTAGYLALSGSYKSLWQLFGTANQLMAALALVVISVYLLYRGRNYIVAFVPAVFMVLTTLGSLLFYFYKYAFVSFNLTYLIIDIVLLSIALVSYVAIFISLLKGNKTVTEVS
jgi:carbon starvation protein